MSVKGYGHLFIQDAAPGESPVMVGSLWSDTLNGLVKRCSSISPYTFVSVANSPIDLTTGVTGILPVLNGGTGVNSLSPSAFTPSLSGFTLGNGSMVGSYVQIGKLVFWEIRVIFGSTTSISGTAFFGLPVNAQDIRAIAGNCTGWYFDFSANTSYQANNVSVANNQVLPTVYASTSAQSGNTPITPTLPFTWAVSDEIILGGFYFAA